MRKLLMGLMLITACTSRTTVTPVPVGSGANGPRSALDAFLSSIRAKDLQQLGAVWGDKEGPIRDSKRISRDDLEKRELLLMCYFNHDSFKVLSDAPAAGGERVMSVSLTKGTMTRTTNFYLVSGSDRWFVRTADIEPVRDLCKTRK